MNRWIVMCAGAVMLLGIGSGCPKRLPPTEEAVEKTADIGPIRIGWLGPLVGDAAPVGRDALVAAALAVDEVNAAGGVGGRMLQIVPEDTQCSATVAFRAGNKLVAFDQVKFIVGGVCAGDTLGIASTTEKNSVIVFSGCSGAPEISEAGEFIFRLYPSDAHESAFIPATAEDWVQKLAARGGTNTHCAPGVYNSVHLLVDVLRRVGTDTRLVKEELYRVNGYPGVNGPVTIDENGDLADDTQ